MPSACPGPKFSIRPYATLHGYKRIREARTVSLDTRSYQDAATHQRL
jgi:hypothetical protein